MRGAVFDDLIRRLPATADCLAPDLPGHASAAARPATLGEAASVLHELVEAAPAPPVVVGWSMGAAVAWAYVARHGAGALGGLVTLDMSPRMVPAPDWPHGLLDQTPESIAAATCRMQTDWPGSARAIAATMFAQDSDPRPFGRTEALAQILREDPVRMRRLWAELLAMDARAHAGRVSCPWLVAYGARSRVYGRGAAEWLHDAAPSSELVGFARSGHSAHLEEPDLFARRLSDFAAAV